MTHKFIIELTDTNKESYDKTVERLDREFGIEEVGDFILIENVMSILKKYKLDESKISEEVKENKEWQLIYAEYHTR